MSSSFVMQLLIVEDHRLVREGLRLIVDSLGKFERAIECGTLEEALEHATRLDDDRGLVILDLGLPDVTGIEALERMTAALPGVPVLVVSGEDDPQLIAAAFACGARGFVPKNSSGPALRVAIETVLQGELYVPPHVLPSLTPAHGIPAIDGARRPSAIPPSGISPSSFPQAVAPTAASASSARLTPRQRDVLRLVARGLTNKDIANELDMSLSTVRVHVTAVLKSLGVENRTQAALSALAKSLGD